ncbi:MAG: transcription termination/antitermination protein NusA [Acidobacteria bacterium]|nr:transcription termination/antitermination protein NusA [Acidobacteriota bacterium]
MLLQTIEQIGREKNIAPEVIIAAIEEAMAVAAQKFYRTEDYLVAKLDPESGDVAVNAVKKVVEEVEDPLSEITVEDAVAAGMESPELGAEMRTPMPTEGLGRIAAQAAKQVIFQKVRDAERDNIFAEYEDRVGELLTGSVKRFERGDMIIDLGRAEAILPRREQSRAEHYNIGDRIRVVVIEVLRDTRGPLIVVSRSSPELLLRLFEMEVPEIYDGTVLVKGAVREGGDRAKVAVHSLDADIDPVGACVGMRGSRVQGIIRELRGEKIDIVDWAEDPFQFAINALKPAKVNKVNEVFRANAEGIEEPHLEVLVDEDQLSLAIGKRGQNVRLAGKLLGRKIDVMSPDQKEHEQSEAAETSPEVGGG